jgi:hypothetical protein
MAQVNRDRNSLTHSVQGNLNLYNKNGNSLTAGAFAEGTRYFNGPVKRENRFGGNLDWQNQRGHSVSAQFQRVPQYNMNTFGTNGNVNLYDKGGLKVDAYGGASRSWGPYSNGRTDWNGGVKGIWRFK